MKRLLIWQSWIIVPCATVIIVAILAAICILGTAFLLIDNIFKLIKFLIPIDKIKKPQPKKETKTKLESDLEKFRLQFAQNERNN